MPTADSAGVAVLPPLRPGEAVIRARAEGYLPSESLHLEVEPHADDEELTLRLQKTKPEQRLRLLLPDGKPALGAQIRAQSSLANAVPLWYGSTDAQGVVQLPREAIGSVLLVRHPQAGFLVQSFQDEVTTHELVWTLPAAAPPLWVKVRQLDGRPAPWVSLALWSTEWRLSGSTLAWLTFSAAAATDREGLWQVRQLPQRSIYLLAWSAEQTTSLQAGELDPLAVAVPFPWPEMVELQLLD